MQQNLYQIYLHYRTIHQSENDEFLSLVSFFEKYINYELQKICTNDKEDLKQECFMVIDYVFRKKTLKMNRNYYYEILDYKKKHQINVVNWNEYYHEKITYRNLVGTKIIQTYLHIAFSNLIKDSLKKKRPLLLLNRYDENGVEYIEYIKSNDEIRIDMERLLLKHIAMFNSRQIFIIDCKLKYYRKGDCPKFRYITTSG